MNEGTDEPFDPDAPYLPIWPLVVLVLVTLAPVSVILYDVISDKPDGMPLMWAINDPEVGTGLNVYAILIGMLVWLVSIPGTIIYSMVLAGAWVIRRRRRRRARHGIM